MPVWEITLIIIAVLFCGAWFGIGFLGFRIAIGRGRELDIYNREALKGTSWDLYYDVIMDGIQWVHEHPAEDIDITSEYDGIPLHGRLIRHPDAEGCVIMFHGYRTCADVDFGAACPVYYGCRNDLLLVDERACGKSGGRYIGFGVLERYDAKSWADYICERFGKDRRIIFAGLSMGASTALMALSLQLPGNVCGIVADSAFSSPYDIIRSTIHRNFHLGGRGITAAIGFWCRLLAGYSLKEMSVPEAIHGTRISILFAHGTADSRVPVQMTYCAAKQTAGQTILIITEGSEHGTGFLADHERYVEAIQKICSAPCPKSGKTE